MQSDPYAALTSSTTPSLEREVTRKQYVASLESRTATEIAEEEALFTELKRLEQNERRYKKDRDDLLRTILGIESGLPDIHAEDESLTSSQANEGTTSNRKTKKKGANEPETPTSGGPNATISLGPAMPKKQSAKSAAYGDYLLPQYHCDPDKTSLQTLYTAYIERRHLKRPQLPEPKQHINPCTFGLTNYRHPSQPSRRRSRRCSVSWVFHTLVW